jgi:ubiquinol-cytochrome c reductase iron-sulfur subunit
VADHAAGATTDPAHSEPSRRDFIHIAALAAAVGGVAAVAWPLVDQMNPSSDVRALSTIDVDLSRVPVGQQVVVKWRGRPLFVRHRTPAEIAAAVHDDHADLKDPASDASRVKPGHAEWLILVGVCTHLGCVPNFGLGEYHGWFCPCHGSVYDTSGRIRHGPAPHNLEVPEYSFTNPTTIHVG